MKTALNVSGNLYCLLELSGKNESTMKAMETRYTNLQPRGQPRGKEVTIFTFRGFLTLQKLYDPNLSPIQSWCPSEYESNELFLKTNRWKNESSREDRVITRDVDVETETTSKSQDFSTFLKLQNTNMS